MAKNNNRNISLGSDYDQMQANIRKAKGNPNKNVHQKKNGSNYKGYAAQRDAQSAKAKAVQAKDKLPTWVVIIMAVVFVVLVTILILMNSVLKDSLFFAQLSLVVIGACCGILFSLRRYTQRKDSKFQNTLYTVLAVMAVVLIFVGGYGLLRMPRL